jgi:hypothetical protein
MRLGWLATLVAFMAASPASATWLEARTRHFVLYADMGEKGIRDRAMALERLDWAMRRFMRVEDAEDTAHNQVTVYWVAPSEFQSLCKCPDIAGFYQPRVNGSVAFASRNPSGDDEQDFGRVVLFHEYAHHFLLGSYDLAFPAWFSEGFAEFASTLRLQRDSATMGAAAQHRAWGLLRGRRLSARDLFDPKVWNDLKLRSDGDAFYGRGWLMTHYLLFSPERMGQFKTYLTALNKGVSSVEAAQQAFGDLDALSRDLERYLNRTSLPALTMRFGDTPAPAVAIRPLSDGEAAMMKMRMASTRGVDEKEAAAVYARAAPVAARYPDDPVVQGWLAEMAYDAKDDAASLSASDRALARDPRSVQALLYRARANLRKLSARHDAKAEAWAAARKPILAANRLDTEDAEPMWLFWQSFAMEGREPPKSAFLGLYKAQSLIPQDPGVRFTAGMAHLNAGEGDAARVLLRPLAYNPHAPADNPAARIVAALDAGKSAKEAQSLLVGVVTEKKDGATN